MHTNRATIFNFATAREKSYLANICKTVVEDRADYTPKTINFRTPTFEYSGIFYNTFCYPWLALALSNGNEHHCKTLTHRNIKFSRSN